VGTLLVDPAPGRQGEQTAPSGSAAPAGEPGSRPAPDAAGESLCATCLAPMAAGQDWCLQCGAGAPGSLSSPSWRPAAAVATAVAVLVLGAAAAGYAALNNKHGKPPVVTKTVAQAAVPAAPATTTPATGLPATPGGAASTPKAGGAPGLGTAKPPKIPLTAVTPKASSPSATTPTTQATTPAATTPSKATTAPAGASHGSEGKTGEAEPGSQAILLDTNAASTYNPYDLPAAYFGDPSLAIDGDPTTAWTAEVDPSSAPTMAEGLLIDLKSKQKVSAMELITTTPGMTVQVYGTKGATAPASITDPAWTALDHSTVIKKKSTRLKLRDSRKAFTYLTLWISKAPQSAVGTPEAPGHVSVDEVELFPPA
jgi:hypothetical protein